MEGRNSYTLFIDNCHKCENHYSDRIYTPDSFELEYGCFCSRVPDVKSVNGKHKLVEINTKKDCVNIPDWCPMLKKGD